MQLRRLLCIATAVATTSAPAWAESSAEKKALIDKVMALQQSSIEGLGRGLARQSVEPVTQAARQLLQTRVASDKREATARQIDNALKDYLDEIEPLLGQRAIQAAPGTVAPLLDEQFTEDELRTLAAWLESPVSTKFQQASPRLANALMQRLVDDNRAAIDPKLRTLEDRIAKLLGVPARPGAASAPASGASGKAKR